MNASSRCDRFVVSIVGPLAAQREDLVVQPRADLAGQPASPADSRRSPGKTPMRDAKPRKRSRSRSRSPYVHRWQVGSSSPAGSGRMSSHTATCPALKKAYCPSHSTGGGKVECRRRQLLTVGRRTSASSAISVIVTLRPNRLLLLVLHAERGIRSLAERCLRTRPPYGPARPELDRSGAPSPRPPPRCRRRAARSWRGRLPDGGDGWAPGALCGYGRRVQSSGLHATIDADPDTPGRPGVAQDAKEARLVVDALTQQGNPEAKGQLGDHAPGCDGLASAV